MNGEGIPGNGERPGSASALRLHSDAVFTATLQVECFDEETEGLCEVAVEPFALTGSFSWYCGAQLHDTLVVFNCLLQVVRADVLGVTMNGSMPVRCLVPTRSMFTCKKFDFGAS